MLILALPFLQYKKDSTDKVNNSNNKIIDVENGEYKDNK